MLRPLNPIQVFSPYWFDIAGKRLKSSDPGLLFAMVHEVDNSIESYEQWYPLMIHRMCLEMPKGTCGGDDEGDAYVKTLRWPDIIGFVNAIISVAVAGLTGKQVYATQAEADRRSFICGECPLNKHVACTGCVGIISLADKFIRGRYAKGQATLGACKACGCWLPAKIWASEDALRFVLRKQKDLKYPDRCWNKELLS